MSEARAVRVYLTGSRPGPAIRLVLRDHGCVLRHRDGYDVAGLSLVDAAELLWQLRDELRRHPLGQGCIDDAHRKRSSATGATR